MATKIGIMNTARALLQTEPINSFTSGPPKVTSMSAIYDVLKGTIISQNSWRFSMKTQQLAQINSTPDYPNYLYMFQRPTDCIQMIQVYAGPYQNISDYELIGQQIYSNVSPLYLLYSSNVPENLFPFYYEWYFASKLAAACALLFTESPDLAVAYNQQATNVMNEALATDSMQHPSVQITNFPSVAVRNYC